MLTRADWVALGRQAVLELLAEHHAAPLSELEARICDQPWTSLPRAVDPHMLRDARRELLASERIAELSAPTRGGGEVSVYHLNPITRGKNRATTDAAARKRILIARWKSWSRGSEHMPNLIGVGGETVVHQSLAAAPFGYRLVQPTRGEVSTVYGQPVPGGPLDNAAWLFTMDQQTQAPSGPVCLVPIEVKNVRHWLYPNHWEVYQLLHKSAGLANAQPQHPVLPVLICRKAHYRTMELAKDLGFLIFQTYHQYVLPSERVSAEHFEEVRAELAFTDLMMTADPNPALVKWFSGVLHREAAPKTERWMGFGRHMIDYFAVLRDERLKWRDRTSQLEALHRDAVLHTGRARGWAPEVAPDYDV